MFRRLGGFTARHPVSICLVWLALGLSLAWLAPSWDAQAQDDDVRFLPDRFTSVRAYQLLEKAFPQDVFASRVVFALERDDGPLTPSDFALVKEVVNDLEKLRIDAPELKIGKIDSFQDGIVGGRLVSADRQCTLIQASLGTPYLAISTHDAVERADSEIRSRFAILGDQHLQLFTTGAAGLGHDLTKATDSSLHDTTAATIVLVIVVLLLVYRAPLLALVPLATIACSVWVSLNVLALMAHLPGVHLVSISKIFAIVILYGAGTDYCLFLIGRYREELENGVNAAGAIPRSLGSVGEALAASAGTVMVSLGLMVFAEFAKVRYAGPAIALSLGIALLASLTLTPALLRILGAFAFWPFRQPTRREPSPLWSRLRLGHDGFWEWMSQIVARRPIWVWSVAALMLAPLVIVGLRVEPNYRATGELSPSSPSLLGLAAIERHFIAGELGPVTVLLASNADWASRDGRLQVDHLSRSFAKLPNVAEVRSLTQPLGWTMVDWTPPIEGEGLLYQVLTYLQPTIQSLREGIFAKSKDHYVAQIDENGSPRYVTRLDIVLRSNPFEPESAETLKLIQTWLRRELPTVRFVKDDIQAECYGVTASGQDLATVSEGDRHRINWLVLASVFAILVVLVRRFWLAAYLLMTVLASYFAALGATVLVGSIWGGAPLNQVDWRVPFFLFTILVAVGEDYNILLISRALQERKLVGAREGMRRALSRTGGSITSCGLIMAGTFATLMLSGLTILFQIGFALAFGVLVDTFVVRPFLVPAFAIVFWRDSRDKPVRKDHDVNPGTEKARQDMRRAA